MTMDSSTAKKPHQIQPLPTAMVMELSMLGKFALDIILPVAPLLLLPFLDQSVSIFRVHSISNEVTGVIKLPMAGSLNLIGTIPKTFSTGVRELLELEIIRLSSLLVLGRLLIPAEPRPRLRLTSPMTAHGPQPQKERLKPSFFIAS